MNDLELLILGVIFGIFIMPIILVVWNVRQGSRIKALEEALYGQREPKVLPQEKPEKPLDLEELQRDVPKEKPQTVSKKVPRPPQKDFHWEDFFTKKFFGILGALSVVLAIGFFGVWAFAHGLIGPSGRIAIGILVSLILLVGGELTREKYPKYFAYLSSAGIAGLLITTFVARNLYGFLDPMQSFSAYVFEVVVGVFLALRYDSRVLGNFSIAAGLLAPTLVQGDPHELGLLSYLAILTAGGFVVSLRQKWPEILILLFLGICAYEGLLFDAIKTRYVKEEGVSRIVRTGFIVDHCCLFLGFSFFMHWLLGLGGIFRSVREKLTQSWDESAKSITVLEMVLMIVSVIAFNGMAATIFEWKDWPYLGFFLLAQGFVLFFLSEYLKKASLPYFQRIAISGTLITIILATILEIGATNQEWLTIALMLEGILMIVAAGELKDKWIGLFGRLTLFIGTGFGVTLSIWWAALAIILYGAGNMMAFVKAEKSWERVFSVVGIIWFILITLGWNFEHLKGLLGFGNEVVLLFILPTVLSVALAYTVIKSRNTWSVGLGLGTILLGTFIGLETITRIGYLTHRVPVGLTILVFLLLGYFGVLASAFLEDKGKHLVSQESQKIITKVVLGATTLLTLIIGAEIFTEPLVTIFWIIWGILLLVLGTKNQWPTFRYFGIGTLLLVIAKLYLIDVWGWNSGEKVLAFSVLGVTLLGLSFYAQKKK